MKMVTLSPVRSYKNYMSHLNPKCEKLWQHSLKSIPKTGLVQSKSIGTQPYWKISWSPLH